MAALRAAGVEFRRGTAGGGNQLRQPYLRRVVGDDAWKRFPNVDHIHFYGMYIGNFPDLEPERIVQLCRLLNEVRA
jgi:CDP-6-deoxy-D-xylo-4-hexulose-3-dehydrase